MDEHEVASYIAAYQQAHREHAEFTAWMHARHRQLAGQLTDHAHQLGWLPQDLELVSRTCHRDPTS